MIVLISSTVLMASLICASAEDDKAEAFIKWASSHAIPIKTVEPGAPSDDLHPLRNLIGDARVVSLGDSRHDAREHFQFKHRLIRFLVEEMGFTRIAMEESLPCAMGINEFVLHGRGDPEALLDGLGGWFIWDTEEVLALVKWMREHNQAPSTKRKVQFHGIDISDPKLGLVNVLSYLERVDPEAAAPFQEKPDALGLFSDVMWPRTMENYRRLSTEELSILADRYARLLARFDRRRSDYVGSSSVEQYEWVRRQALVTSQANDLYSAFPTRSFAEAGDIREQAMADNIRWILRRAGEDERLIVWAHNFHVTRCVADLNVPQRPAVDGMRSMVAYLSEELGDDLVSIGFTFEHGDSRNGPLPRAGRETVDGVLARVALPSFVLDLRPAPNGWAGQKLRIRGQGGYADLVLTDAFDAIVFTEKVTSTVPTRGAQERFRSLRH